MPTGGRTCSVDLVMHPNFHESFAQAAVKPPSERSTGLVFTAVALLVAYLRRDNPTALVSALCAAGVLVLLSALAPILLRPLNLLWFRISVLMHKVVNPIVMFAIFAVVFVPGGLLMRFFRDPLRARRDPKLTTYWVERTGDDGVPSPMRHQF
jgi:hypothetical protein